MKLNDKNFVKMFIRTAICISLYCRISKSTKYIIVKSSQFSISSFQKTSEEAWKDARIKIIHDSDVYSGLNLKWEKIAYMEEVFTFLK